MEKFQGGDECNVYGCAPRVALHTDLGLAQYVCSGQSRQLGDGEDRWGIPTEGDAQIRPGLVEATVIVYILIREFDYNAQRIMGVFASHVIAEQKRREFGAHLEYDLSDLMIEEWPVETAMVFDSLPKETKQ